MERLEGWQVAGDFVATEVQNDFTFYDCGRSR